MANEDGSKVTGLTGLGTGGSKLTGLGTSGGTTALGTGTAGASAPATGLTGLGAPKPTGLTGLGGGAGTGLTGLGGGAGTGLTGLGGGSSLTSAAKPAEPAPAAAAPAPTAAPAPAAKPKGGIAIDVSAAERIKELLAGRGTPEAGLRIRVRGGGCTGLQYDMEFADDAKEKDRVFADHGVRIFVDPKSYIFLIGTTLRYQSGLLESGFKLENPNAKKSCGCGESFSV